MVLKSLDEIQPLDSHNKINTVLNHLSNIVSSVTGLSDTVVPTNRGETLCFKKICIVQISFRFDLHSIYYFTMWFLSSFYYFNAASVRDGCESSFLKVTKPSAL